MFLIIAMTSLVVAVKGDNPCLLALVPAPNTCLDCQLPEFSIVIMKGLISDYLSSTHYVLDRIGLGAGKQHWQYHGCCKIVIICKIYKF